MDAYTEALGMLDNVPVLAITGEAVAGEAAKTLKRVKTLVSGLNTSTFDLMDALHAVKVGKYYQPKFDSFIDYAKTLDMKVTKAYYLVRIKENMLLSSIPREKYEGVGIAKLRIISSIDLIDSENRVKTDAVTKVNEIVATAVVTDAAAIKTTVDTYNGHVGDEAFEWLNIKIKKSAKDVVRQALDLVKAQIGTVGQDSDGKAKDPSDGNALEKLAADYLSDPNNTPDVEKLGVTVVPEGLYDADDNEASLVEESDGLDGQTSSDVAQ